MADNESKVPREPTEQASELELQASRLLKVNRVNHPVNHRMHPLEHWRDAQILEHIQINHDALGDWLGVRQRASQSPVPQRRCGHCRVYAASPIEWRPNNPLMMLLCSTCRAEVYRLAEETATRTGRRVGEHLDTILKALCLAD